MGEGIGGRTSRRFCTLRIGFVRWLVPRGGPVDRECARYIVLINESF